MPADKYDRAFKLRFRSHRIVVVLTDGREISVPLKFYPTLQCATVRGRSRWQVIGDGQGFHWTNLDLDLSIDGLIEGIRETVHTPAVRQQIAGRCSDHETKANHPPLTPRFRDCNRK